MKFSEFYAISRADDDDWFDILMTEDTRLYVDPFRVYADTALGWKGAHDYLLAFFGMVLTYVKESRNNAQSPAWSKAGSLLLFPEPAEFCLGMAVGSPNGSGSGRGLQQPMLEAARTAVGLGMVKLEHMETLVLFSGGIGVDRISDITCNVLKSYFIRYTQAVCRRHGVIMERFRVRHSGWDQQFGRWVDDTYDLPVNPFSTRRRIPVLLTPERFLREIPTVDPSEFWNFAWADEGAQLRADFNYDLAKNVPAHVKAQLARQHPDIVARYLRALETAPKPPYDLTTDPHHLVRWYEQGRTIADKCPLSFIPAGPAEFSQFVKAMIESFKHGIEESDAWTLLWYNGRHRHEKQVQALFRSTVLHYCRAHNIVLTGESNAGRGPVDFKFAANWRAQALVEIKLIGNSSFWDGLQEQTVQYLKSEEVHVGYFVVIGFKENDFDQGRLAKIKQVAKRVSGESGKEIQVIFADARPKLSASKLRKPREQKPEE